MRLKNVYRKTRKYIRSPRLLKRTLSVQFRPHKQRFLDTYGRAKNKYDSLRTLDKDTLEELAEEYEKYMRYKLSSLYGLTLITFTIFLFTCPFVYYEVYNYTYGYIKDEYVKKYIYSTYINNPEIIVSIGLLAFTTIMYGYLVRSLPPDKRYQERSYWINIDHRNVWMKYYKIVATYVSITLILSLVYAYVPNIGYAFDIFYTFIIMLPVIIGYLYLFVLLSSMLIATIGIDSFELKENTSTVVYEILDILNVIHEIDIQTLSTKDKSILTSKIRKTCSKISQAYDNESNSRISNEWVQRRTTLMSNYLAETARWVALPYSGVNKKIKQRLLKYANTLMTGNAYNIVEMAEKDNIDTSKNINRSKYEKKHILFILLFLLLPIIIVYAIGSYTFIEIPNPPTEIWSIFYIFWSIIGLSALMEWFDVDIKSEVTEIIKTIYRG